MSSALPPLVSVCVANYNGEHLLRDCIDSVLAQDTDASIEILIHDDASDDGSLALLESNYPKVHVLRSERNVGFCIANNRMTAKARGEYLLLLNNDAALAPNAIRALLDASVAINSSAILTVPQRDWITGAIVDRGCLLDPFFNPIPNLDPRREDVAYVIGACLWCPRSTWEDLGGFPEWMESIGEDLYLCSKARLYGIPVRVLHESYYRHRQGASFGGNRGDTRLHTSVRRRHLSELNKTRALMILTPGPMMLPLLVVHLFMLLVESIVLSITQRNFLLLRQIYLPAMLAPIREASFLSMCRTKIQSARAIPSSAWYSTTKWKLRKIELLFRYGLPRID